MSTYVEVNGNPDDVTATGARLKAQADSFATQAQSVLSDITSIEGNAPWGGDAPGQEFVKAYNQTPKDGGAPFSDSLKDELSHAGEQLGKAGDAIMSAMVGYQSTDITNKDDISKV
jgi:hypothetical protein